MHLYAKRVSTVASGDYYQILFDSADRDEEQVDPFDQPEPYLMVQCQFEFSDGGKCYVESDDDEYIGHFKLKLVEFTTTCLVFEIARRDHNRVEVSFVMTAAEFKEAWPIVEVIFGIKEPDCDKTGFDGAH
ncbi:MAG: hypothetical protein IPK44_09105 [Candidatus Accumulibacter sp.]|jgi:hypothetical protein|uniref:hypothetical protein n=1 Tax=Accumulibacter sp. TaxID=2053492 RepID=UPI002583EEC2|nr:hypothetical protein [Accumulibacter sp.]MBK8114667.1 hypothetical protein [Accumulibacter sp.]